MAFLWEKPHLKIAGDLKNVKISIKFAFFPSVVVVFLSIFVVKMSHGFSISSIMFELLWYSGRRIFEFQKNANICASGQKNPEQK